MKKYIKISTALLILITLTLSVNLYSQKVKSTLRVNISSIIDKSSKTGTVNLTFENGNPSYYIVMANDENMHKKRIIKNSATLENIPIGYYTIAITDTNKLFFIGHIDLK